jgi:hypothetical protein
VYRLVSISSINDEKSNYMLHERERAWVWSGRDRVTRSKRQFLVSKTL